MRDKTLQTVESVYGDAALNDASYHLDGGTTVTGIVLDDQAYHLDDEKMAKDAYKEASKTPQPARIDTMVEAVEEVVEEEIAAMDADEVSGNDYCQ